MRGEFLAAISQLSLERGVPREVLISSVEAAVKDVYLKSYQPDYEVEVEMDPNSGQAQVFRVLRIAEPVSDPNTEIGLAAARQLRATAAVGEVIRQNINPPSGFGRIAAQKTKQTLLQKIREAEHATVYGEYENREGELINGVIARVELAVIVVNLGKAEGIMPRSEQVDTENYRPGQHLKVLLKQVNETPRGPQLILSRRDKTLLRRLFEIEVPEIFSGAVEIKGIARIAGERSKVAVTARQPGIDPVGSCVGVRGIRVQNVVDEVSGERVDIIEWDSDPASYVGRALSPAQVTSVSLSEADKTATVLVPERQLSLAIGKNGQNARLAANLTSWRIDIRSAESFLQGDDTDDGAREEHIAGASDGSATSAVADDPRDAGTVAHADDAFHSAAEIGDEPSRSAALEG